MWYCGLHGEYKRAGYATNSDGYGEWTKHAGNPIIDVGPPGSFDATGFEPGAVIFRDGLYRMWSLKDGAVKLMTQWPRARTGPTRCC